MSAEAVAAVQSVLAEWSGPDGRLFVEPDERAEFDAEIRDAAMGKGDLERFQQQAARFLTLGGDQINYRVTVTDVQPPRYREAGGKG